MILGIAGRAGCGKSTLAGMILNANGGDRNKCQVRSFADPLRDVAQAVFGSRYETQEEKAAVDVFWTKRLCTDSIPGTPFIRSMGGYSSLSELTGRDILQRIGTELFREHVHPDIWLYAMERRLPPAGIHVIIPDVRFENEAAWIRSRGGRVVHLERIGQPPEDDSHASAQRLPMETRDIRAVAEGLDGLRRIAQSLVQEYVT